MAGVLSSLVATPGKLLLGSGLVAVLALGDFFFAHRLAVGYDVALVVGVAYQLGVDVAFRTPVSAIKSVGTNNAPLPPPPPPAH